MSGHSKWKTIKHKKEATDAKRGKMFTRLTREITIAAKEGGGDIETNFSLRLAVDKAKGANMPKENIDRAIKRGTGELKGEDLVEVVYEGYAPHGVGLLIEVLTDNRNRTVAEIRHALSRNGGTMADAGAVSWQFERKGYIGVAPNGGDPESVFDVAVEAGADDVVISTDLIEVFAPQSDFQAVRQALEDAGIETDTVELSMIPKATIELEPAEALKVMGIIEMLEDLDDTQQVYSNLEISDDLMVQYEGASG
jgi:YebC/PmpR family DNA-binding regulatory protein